MPFMVDVSFGAQKYCFLCHDDAFLFAYLVWKGAEAA
jgi:hypothetical protein